MKKQSRLNRLLIAAALFAGVVGAGSTLNAETIQKLKASSIAKVINLAVGSTSAPTGRLHDGNVATLGVSTTIDLAGGYTDKLSYTVVYSSAAGSGVLTSKVQISPDGGTNWVDMTAAANSITPVLTGGASQYANIAVQPGNKARIVLALSGSTTFYSVKVWALPSVD